MNSSTFSNRNISIHVGWALIFLTFLLYVFFFLRDKKQNNNNIKNKLSNIISENRVIRDSINDKSSNILNVKNEIFNSYRNENELWRPGDLWEVLTNSSFVHSNKYNHMNQNEEKSKKIVFRGVEYRSEYRNILLSLRNENDNNKNKNVSDNQKEDNSIHNSLYSHAPLIASRTFDEYSQCSTCLSSSVVLGVSILRGIKENIGKIMLRSLVIIPTNGRLDAIPLEIFNRNIVNSTISNPCSISNENMQDSIVEIFKEIVTSIKKEDLCTDRLQMGNIQRIHIMIFTTLQIAEIIRGISGKNEGYNTLDISSLHIIELQDFKNLQYIRAQIA